MAIRARFQFDEVNFFQDVPKDTPNHVVQFKDLSSGALVRRAFFGVEVKVLAKAMIKQIDRVKNDLRHQVTEFKLGGGSPICIAVVGINQAESMTSYEGDRPWPTTGAGGFLHPLQEAPEAERRLRAVAQPEFDEFLVLRFKATNTPPYLFEWVNYKDTRLDYAAALSRVSARYQQRF